MMHYFFISLYLFTPFFYSQVIAKEIPKQPELKVTTVDSQSFDLSTQKGNWVIINFWATWCSPCLKEMPEIDKFVTSHSKVKAIGLAFDEITISELKKFMKEHPVTYPIALVDTYNPPKDFGSPRGLPTTYLIAPDGTVAKKFVGPITVRDLEKVVGNK